jgi:hypothetical protein
MKRTSTMNIIWWSWDKGFVHGEVTVQHQIKAFYFVALKVSRSSAYLDRPWSNATELQLSSSFDRAVTMQQMMLNFINVNNDSDRKNSNFNFFFISFHFISFHFISFHFISFHFISFHLSLNTMKGIKIIFSFCWSGGWQPSAALNDLWNYF